jgi:hypothetical protein
VNQILMPHHSDPVQDAALTPHEVLATVNEDSIIWEHEFAQGTIEEVLLAYNHESFRKAAESPLGSGLMFDNLKFSILSTAGSEILSGQAPPSWDVKDPRLVAFLTSFAIPDNVKNAPPIQTTISEEDFIYGIKGWKEKTSMSPSGCHLGHYKAIIEDPSFYVNFLINSLAMVYLLIDGRTPSTCVLIEKDSGEPKVNRLRIIHLFKADYNFVLKVLCGLKTGTTR